MVEKRVSILAVLDDRLSRPLARISTRFAGVERSVRRLGNALLPLNSAIVRLGVGLAGVGGGREALDLARQQVQAEQALLSALQGRTDELEKIKQVASDIQAETIIGDESLLEIASLLTRMGVEAERLPQALKVAADTSAALQVQLPLVARGIARSLTQGQAGLLGQRVPFLQDLLDNGATAEEILDRLGQAFEGAGAALAEGPFGQAQQLSNAIGDSLEEIGKVLITFVVPVLDRANDILQRFVTLLGDRRVQVFLEFAQRLAPILVTVAAAFAGLVTAATLITIIGPGLGTILSVLGSIAGIVTGIVTGIGVIPALVAIIVARVLSMLNAWSKIKDAIFQSTAGIRASVGRVLSLFRAVIDGRADFEELFALITLELENLSLKFFKFILEPIKFVFRAVRDIIQGTVDFGIGLAVGGTLTFLDKFLQLIQGGVNLAIGALRKVGLEIEEVSFGDALGEDAEFWTQKMIEGSALVNRAVGDAYTQLRAEQKKLTEEINENSRQAAEIAANAEEIAFQRAKTRIIAAGKDGIAQIALLDAAIAETLTRAGEVEFDANALFANLNLSTVREALEGLSSETQASLTQIIQAELDRRLKAEEISAAEYFKLRIALENKISEREVQAIDDQIAEKRRFIAQLEDQQRIAADYLEREKETLQQMEDAEKSVDERRQQLAKIETIQQGLVKSNQEQAQAAEDLLNLEKERAGVEVDRANFDVSREALRTSLADEIVREVEEAKRTLEQRRQEIASSVLSGEILPSTGIELSTAALEDFNEQADAAILALEDLAGKRTVVEEAAANMAVSMATFGLVTQVAVDDATDSLDEFIAKIDEAVEGANEPAPEGGFFSGLESGITRTANVLGNFGIQGERIGARLVEDFGKGLVDVWVEGEQSFSDFAKTFLASIAKMIAEMLVFRAISSTLGAFGLGAPAGAEGGLYTGAGFVHHFAGGGPVPGPWTMRDTVNARLMPGEWVHDFQTTRYYGVNWMAAMKKRLIPREYFGAVASAPPVAKTNFNEGGPVVPMQGQSMPGRSVVVADEQSFDRMIRGGRAALLDVLAEEGIRPTG